MNKRPLQVVTAGLGLIPVVTGSVAMLGVADPLYASLGLPRSALLDNNLRLRVVCGVVFLGGVGRLLSMAALGAPPAPFIGFTILELVGAPTFVYWQHLVAAREA